MKITLSGLVDDINGKVDRLSYYKANGKQLLRTVPSGLTPPTTNQLDVRNAYASLYNFRKNMTFIPRESYANAYDLQGLGWWALYVKNNMNFPLDASKYIPVLADTKDNIIALNLTVTRLADLSLHFEWDTESGFFPYHPGWICARTPNAVRYNGVDTSVIYSDKEFWVPSFSNATDYHFWVYFYNTVNNHIGQSAYVFLPQGIS